jgi:predicted acetyltransferase
MRMGTCPTGSVLYIQARGLPGGKRFQAAKATRSDETTTCMAAVGGENGEVEPGARRISHEMAEAGGRWQGDRILQADSAPGAWLDGPPLVDMTTAAWYHSAATWDSSMDTHLRLVTPASEFLPSYRAALEQGWSPDNVLGEQVRQRELAAIAADPGAFVAGLTDREAKGGPVHMPDGTTRPRLPGFRKWLWDGEFAGSIGFRWQPGSAELPPHVLGHIGYAVVPWKQRRGYATQALAIMLEEAREEGLPHVLITTDVNNEPSQKVITRNGGVFVKKFQKGEEYSHKEAFLYRIDL